MELRWRVGPIVVATRDHDGGRRTLVARRTGSLLLAHLVRELTGTDRPVSRRCPSCGATDHGRPVVAGDVLVLSLSYGEGAVAAAAAPRESVAGLGVDIERGLAGDEAIPDFSLREWTRVEAAMKADGRGSLLDPTTALLDPHSVRFPDAPAWSSTVLPAPALFQVAIAHRRR